MLNADIHQLNAQLYSQYDLGAENLKRTCCIDCGFTGPQSLIGPSACQSACVEMSIKCQIAYRMQDLENFHVCQRQVTANLLAQY